MNNYYDNLTEALQGKKELEQYYNEVSEPEPFGKQYKVSFTGSKIYDIGEDKK